jgi:hypothetical protein
MATFSTQAPYCHWHSVLLISWSTSLNERLRVAISWSISLVVHLAGGRLEPNEQAGEVPQGVDRGRQREGKQQLAVQVGTDDTSGGDYRLSGGTGCCKATVNAFAITFEGRTPIS